MGAFRITRIAALAVNTLTPVYPLLPSRSVTILNGTSGDLEVHASETGTEYVVIAAGWERPIPTAPGRLVRDDRPAFWLKSSSGGLVVVIWS